MPSIFLVLTFVTFIVHTETLWRHSLLYYHSILTLYNNFVILILSVILVSLGRIHSMKWLAHCSTCKEVDLQWIYCCGQGN
jgi:hypothetical protein